MSALEYFPLLVNSLLLFNRIIVNVFNFVIIIYESRSTSFSMKRKNQLNCFELKERNVFFCVLIFFPSSPKYQTKPRKKKYNNNLFTLFSALRLQRTVFICSKTVKLHLSTWSAEGAVVETIVIPVYILFINVNIMSCLERCVKNCLRILRYCLCLRMIVAFYFSERDENIIINIVCTV